MVCEVSRANPGKGCPGLVGTVGRDWVACPRTTNHLAFPSLSGIAVAAADSWGSQGLHQHQEAHDQGHGEEDAQEEAVHHTGQAFPVLMAVLGSPVATEGVGNGGYVVQQGFLMAETPGLMARASWGASRRLGTGR